MCGPNSFFWNVVATVLTIVGWEGFKAFSRWREARITAKVTQEDQKP